MLEIKPCPKCGHKAYTWDCGYSSFNVGGVRCGNRSCNHEVKVSPCSCFPEKELITEWNKQVKYTIDVFTPNSVGTKFPENSYDAFSPEECANIIKNCSREIAGIAKIEIWIDQKKT